METKTKIIYLDTHIVVWLYAGRTELFPEKIKNLIEQNDLYISPIVELELEYLHETKRLSENAQSIITDLQTRIGLLKCNLSFDKIISFSLKESWTRDPFDRIITAQARLRGVGLITKDRTILKNYKKAAWDR